jgi:putative hydrolase of the HAD superfamily
VRSGYPRAHSTGEALLIHPAILCGVRCRPARYPNATTILQRIRGADPGSAIRPEAIAAIAAVRKAGAKLAILSNELDLFYGRDFRSRLPFLADIDLIVDATYTGVLKPDPRAYALVTQGLTLAAESCVFVDDQIKNIRGAQTAGFRTIHFDVTQPAESYRAALKHFGP